MRIEAFDFDLPEERIALRPARPRDAARMLVVRPDAAFRDAVVSDLPAFLRPGDALVVNDTKVIAAELRGHRHRGEAVVPVGITLHHRDDGSHWRAFARPARRLKPGDRIVFGETATESPTCLPLAAEVVERGEGGEVVLTFELSGPALDQAVALWGKPPLPPYIASRRPTDDADRQDYQTVFAREEGAVAAPTAGLHLTDRLIGEIEAMGVGFHRVTLHVGAGTFLPVKANAVEDHMMHAEWGRIDGETAAALNAARAAGGRIVAVGTTSLRLLESAADKSGAIQPFADETAIFIKPGYRFRAVDLLLTNFHLPRSTLFMLVAAFSGLDTMQAAYRHAIDAGYRFYSYGDACLLYPEAGR